MKRPPSHLLIGAEHSFLATLSRALVAKAGAEQVRWVPDIPGALPLLERDPLQLVYYVADTFSPYNDDADIAYWQRQTRELIDLLELSRQLGFRLFFPSSIAVFGSSAPYERCPDNAPQEPLDSFGLSKRAGERWCRHFALVHAVDVRSLRFPVLIDADAKSSVCRLPLRLTADDQPRPVLMLAEAIRATIEIMEPDNLPVVSGRCYNLNGIAIPPAELTRELYPYRPEMTIRYWNQPVQPGPVSLNDDPARSDWGWAPRYDLLKLVKFLLQR